MQNIGIPGLILIMVIALIVFGPSKLPQIGRAFGQTLKEFKKTANGIMDEGTEEFEIEEGKHTELKKEKR